jgi:hypothetical protein
MLTSSRGVFGAILGLTYTDVLSSKVQDLITPEEDQPSIHRC